MEIDRTGPRVLVLTNMWPSDTARHKGAFVKEQVEALRKYEGLSMDVRIIDGRWEYLREWVALGKVVKEHGYDIVHAHYGLTGAAAIFSVVPLVVTYHGSDVNLRRERVVSWVAAQRAARRIVVSEGMKRLLNTRDVEVIPCGVNVDLFRYRDRAKTRRELGLSGADMGVLFGGDPDNPAKDFPLFKNVVEAISPEVRRKVKVFKLQGLERANVAPFMSAMDVLLFTSKREGSPMVVKEALACDLPVVSVPVGDVAGVIGGVPGCRLVKRGDIRQLAGATEAVLKEGKRAEGAARLRALGLDQRTTARRVADVYRDLHKERGANRAGVRVRA